MNNYKNYSNRGYSVTGETTSLMTKVFGWQAVGLILSAVTAYIVAATPALIQAIVLNKIVFYGLIFAQFGLVMTLGAFIRKMSYTATVGAYLGYALLTGMTLSTIFLVYTMSSIALCFGIAAGMFGIMALYGYFTDADLSGFGSIMMLGVVGIIIASVINMFMHSDTAQYVISFIAVLVFTGLTAYDVQKIKAFGSMAEDGETMGKVAVFGALTLYLDFLNIFLHLLNLLGNRRRD